ncbi:GNAT family N-acetyltransferase [Lachnospiraceae bacterium ZAX-1]
MVNLVSMYDLNKVILNKVLELDAKVYPKRYQGTFDEEYNKYIANIDSYLFLVDETNLVGYMSFFPIKDTLYEEIKKGTRMFDTDIEGNSLEKWERGSEYKLFVISIVISPEYQNRGLSKLLRNGFYEFIDKKKKDDIHIVSALATAVSDCGKRFLLDTGFYEIKHLNSGEWLYEATFN